MPTKHRELPSTFSMMVGLLHRPWLDRMVCQCPSTRTVLLAPHAASGYPTRRCRRCGGCRYTHHHEDRCLPRTCDNLDGGRCDEFLGSNRTWAHRRCDAFGRECSVYAALLPILMVSSVEGEYGDRNFSLQASSKLAKGILGNELR